MVNSAHIPHTAIKSNTAVFFSLFSELPKEQKCSNAGDTAMKCGNLCPVNTITVFANFYNNANNFNKKNINRTRSIYNVLCPT